MLKKVRGLNKFDLRLDNYSMKALLLSVNKKSTRGVIRAKKDANEH